MSPNNSRTGRFLTVAAAAAFVCAAMAAFPAYASAQDAGGGSGGGRMMTALFEGINLSDAQRKTVDSIRTAYQPQMQQLRSQGPSARPEMREKMQKEMTDFRGVLTSDEQATFDKNRDNMRSQMRNRMGGGGNPQS